MLVKWKEITGFPNTFVSNNGMVKIGSIVQTLCRINDNSSYYVNLRVAAKDSSRRTTYPKRVYIANLVWEYFGSEPFKEGFVLKHIDGVITNNNIDNLELRPLVNTRGKEHIYKLTNCLK